MEAKFIKNKDVIFTEVENEAVLLDGKGGTYFGLDEVGTFVWSKIEEEMNLNQILEEMLTIYQIESGQLEQMHKDIMNFIEELERKSLIYRVENNG
ncbi:PqqD family protein [Bacillus sp. 'calajunan']|uniref:PqqD family protein n=1 Tax=Bacillus sp. 'calajunan' TaxID=3447457 RepID=UPI003EE2525C